MTSGTPPPRGIRWAGWHPAAWAFLGGAVGVVFVLAAVLLAGEDRRWRTVRARDRERARIHRARDAAAARRASRDPEVGRLLTVVGGIGLLAGFLIDRQAPPQPIGNPSRAIALGAVLLFAGIGILIRSRRPEGQGGR